ncbi:hypothetical protein [Luteolibacter soli]|uniref:HTH HARE-type domain-containing protein n=1 Tax=Luteolibacter soli TaxID=3135280 RepID=A0ABU9B3D5_9BACT
MDLRKLGHLRRSVLELARKNDGHVWEDLVYQELFGQPPRAGNGVREPIDAGTRTLPWLLKKRGLLERAPDVRGFKVSEIS